MPVTRVWRIIPLWIAFIVQLNYLSADDSFMCCMSGWKSVRGVVLCPRPCCEGYALRSSILPALGPVTTCELQSSPGDIPPAVPAMPTVSAATPQSPGPVNIPIIALNEDSDIPLSRIPPPARQRGHNRRVRPLSAAVQASLEGEESGAKRSHDVLFPVPANSMHHSSYAGRLLKPRNPELSEPAPTQICSCKREL